MLKKKKEKNIDALELMQAVNMHELMPKKDNYLLLMDQIQPKNVVDHWVQIYIRILKNGNE
jgi:hypothetical protein